MTLLTLAGKCPAFGSAKILPSVSSEASATLPKPSPQRLKNCRRVSNCNLRSSGLIRSLPCQKIVQIQQHSRNTRPGRLERHVCRQHLSELGRRRILGLAIRTEIRSFENQLRRKRRVSLVFVKL